jgi:hypothetical protein
MSNEKQFSQGFTPNLPLWSFQLQKDSKLALKTRKDLEIHLITRALKDESFRAELIANPKAVIEQEIGSKLPDELEITVLEETEDTIYMVLPCNPYEGLSEEELQANLGMTYEDVALWVLEQQRNTLLDEDSSVRIIKKVWTNKLFKEELLNNPNKILEKELGEEFELDMKIEVLTETNCSLIFIVPKVLDDLDIFSFSNDNFVLMSVASGQNCGGNTTVSTDTTCCTGCCPCTELSTK